MTIKRKTVIFVSASMIASSVSLIAWLAWEVCKAVIA